MLDLKPLTHISHEMEKIHWLKERCLEIWKQKAAIEQRLCKLQRAYGECREKVETWNQLRPEIQAFALMLESRMRQQDPDGLTKYDLINRIHRGMHDYNVFMTKASLSDAALALCKLMILERSHIDPKEIAACLADEN